MRFILFYRLVGWVGRRIEHNEQKLEQLATVDQLTGLYNYRMYNSILKAEITRAQRYGRPVSILMLDIDTSSASTTIMAMWLAIESLRGSRSC